LHMLAVVGAALGWPKGPHSEGSVQPTELSSSAFQGWPSDVPPSIVFNLPRCSNRWALIQDSLTAAGIPYSRLVNTADAHAGGVAAHECRLFDNMQCFPSYFAQCKACDAGIVGCAVTHFRGWNSSLVSYADAPWQAFAEDDVEFEAGGSQRLLTAVDAAAQKNPEWKVIFFAPAAAEHNLVGLRQWSGQDDFDAWLDACRDSGAWTSFYVLSNRARKAAVEQMGNRGFAYPLDITVFKLCSQGDCFTQFGGVVGHTVSLDSKTQEKKGATGIVAPMSLTMNVSADC